MWQYLEDFVATTNRPLVLLGDFNDMLSEDKKLGGLLINPTRIRAFRNCLDNCGLRATASIRAKFLSILQKKTYFFYEPSPSFLFSFSFFLLLFILSFSSTNFSNSNQPHRRHHDTAANNPSQPQLQRPTTATSDLDLLHSPHLTSSWFWLILEFDFIWFLLVL